MAFGKTSTIDSCSSINQLCRDPKFQRDKVNLTFDRGLDTMVTTVLDIGLATVYICLGGLLIDAFQSTLRPGYNLSRIPLDSPHRSG